MSGVVCTIRVRLSEQLARFSDGTSAESAQLAGAVQLAAQGLAADLDLPLDFQVAIAPELGTALPGSDVDVWLGARKCGGFIPCDDAADITAEQLARRIAWTIHANRTLLITAEVASALWDKYSGASSATSRPLAGWFQPLIERLVEHCRKLPPGLSLLTHSAAPDVTLEKCFEDATKEMKSPSLSVQIQNASLRNPTPADFGGIEAQFAGIASALFDDIGVLLPKLSVSDDASLDADEFRSQINDVRLPVENGLAADRFMVVGSHPYLGEHVDARQSFDPYNGTSATIVRGGHIEVELCAAYGSTYFGPGVYVIRHLARTVRTHARLFITPEVAGFALGKLYDTMPALVSAVDAEYTTGTLAAVLGELVSDGISVRYLPNILEAMLDLNVASTAGLTPGELAGRLRVAMKPVRSGMTVDVVFNCCRTPAQTDEAIRKGELDARAGEEVDALVAALASVINPGPWLQTWAVLACAPDVRDKLARLIAPYYPTLPVLAVQELVHYPNYIDNGELRPLATPAAVSSGDNYLRVSTG